MAKRPSSTGPVLTKEVRLKFTTLVDGAALNGLNRTIATFKALDAQIQALQKSVMAVSSAKWNLSAASIEQQIKRAQLKNPNVLKPGDLAKLLGITPQNMDAMIAEMRAQLAQGLVKSTGKKGVLLRPEDFFKGDEFRSAGRAAQMIERMRSGQAAMLAHIGNVLTGKVNPPAGGPASMSPGELQAAISALTAAANKIAGGAAAASAGATATGGPLPATTARSVAENEIARRLRVTPRGQTETITRLLSGRRVSETFKDADVDPAVRIERANAMEMLNRQVRTLRSWARHQISQGAYGPDVAGLAAGRLGAFGSTLPQGAAREELQQRIQDLNTWSARMEQVHARAEERKTRAAERQVRQRVKQEVSGQAAIVDANAKAADDAVNWWSKSLRREDRERLRSLLDQDKFLKWKHKQEADLADDRQARAADEVRHINRLHAEQQRVYDKALKDQARRQRMPAGGGGSKDDLLGNFTHYLQRISGWVAAGSVLYGTLDLVNRGFRVMLQTGLQTARLEQVFSGVGGSAKELADDVMRVAAAQGRTTEEALASAIQWSRLNLSRAQATEATRVSLIAANVAEMEAGEATEHLAAVYQAYGLEVGQLSSVLGELNQVSNTYRVTNKDLLVGISRTAAVAKQAGLGLADLIGFIGAAVGATGQTGANIGNAVKSLTVSLSNPAIQKFLRTQFRLELTEGGGSEIRSLSDVLADLYVSYQKLTNVERQHLLYQVAGKTQASRVAALLDNYLRAQTLAVSAQLNLNSAEVENIKIKQTMIAQLRSISTEFDRLVVKQTQRGPAQLLTAGAQTLHSTLALMNTGPGSALTSGIAGILGASSAGMLLRFARGRFNFAGAGDRQMQNAGRAFLQLRGEASQILAGLALGDFSGLGQRLFQGGRSTLGGIARPVGGFLATGFLTLLRFSPQLIAIGGTLWGISKAINAIGEATGATSQKAERDLSGFNAEVERAREGIGAAATAARLFGTTMRAWPKLDAAQRGSALELLGSVAFMTPGMSPAAAAGARKRGTSWAQRLSTASDAEVLNALAERQGVFLTQRSIQRQKTFVAQQAQLDRMLSEKQRLEGSTFGRDRAEQYEKAILELLGKRAQLYNEEIEDLAQINEYYDQGQAANLKNVLWLERQKLTLETISEIYRQIAGSSPTSQSLAGMAAAEVQVSQIQGMQRQLEREFTNENLRAARNKVLADDLQAAAAKMRGQTGQFGKLSPGILIDNAYSTAADELEDRAAKLRNTRPPAEFTKRRSELDEMLKAATVAGGREAGVFGLRQFQTRMRLSSDLFNASVEGSTTGDTELQRLQTREKLLRQAIALREQYLKSGAGTELFQENARLELITARVNLQETELAIQKERLQGAKRELDYRRELLTAGPADLLRKSLAFSLANRPMTAGGFYAMNPQLREEVMRLQELSAYRGVRPRGAGDLAQSALGLDQANLVDMARLGLDRFGGGLQTASVNTDLARLGSSAIAAAEALDRVARAVPAGAGGGGGGIAAQPQAGGRS